MKKNLLLLLVLAVNVQLVFSQSAPPETLTGTELQTWLKANWYDGYHKELGYSAARTAMYSYIDKADDNNVYCVYSGFYQSAASTTFLDPINAEHTVPQSWFSQAEPMRSDIFHLYPTHMNVNSDRGSYPFDEIPDELTDSWYNAINNNYQETSGIPTANIDDYSELDNNLRFEPREQHKGDLARAVFYFYTMYPTQAGNISDIVYGGIQTLYTWHLEDPVSAWELQRNARIEERQGNQNPYIVYPELVCRAWGFDCQVAGAAISLSTTSLPDFGLVSYASANFPVQSYTITANEVTSELVITASENFLISLSATEGFSSTITLPSTFTEETVYVQFAPAQSINDVVNGTITHAHNGNEIQLYVSGTEGNPNLEPVAVLTESFDDCNLADRGWQIVSVSSTTKNWECSTTGYLGAGLYINGYGGDAPAEDWLILPQIQLTTLKQTALNFWVYNQYSDSNPGLEVLLSYNYDGQDVGAAQWQTLAATLPAANSRSWQEVNVDLPLASSSAYVAIKYTSTGTGPGQAALWRIDEVSVTESLLYAPQFYLAEDFALVDTTPQTVYVRLNKKASQDLTIDLSISQGLDLITSQMVAIDQTLDNGAFQLTVNSGDSVANFTLQMVEVPEQLAMLEFLLDEIEGIALPNKPKLMLEVPDAQVLGFEDVIKNTNIVFPNPVENGIIKLGLEEKITKGYDIQLVNFNGQTCWSASLNKAEVELPTSFLPGIYLLIVRTTEEIYTQKIIIK